MTLTEIATSDVVTAERETEIREILGMMDENNVGSVVIADGDEPVGIVTDRMIAMAMREADSLDDLTGGDVMTGEDELVTIQNEDTHFEALSKMSDEGIRRLPVVDEDGALAGIVTLDDLLIVSAAELSNASDVIEQQAGSF